jgi:hypothetical protein
MSQYFMVKAVHTRISSPAPLFSLGTPFMFYFKIYYELTYVYKYTVYTVNIKLVFTSTEIFYWFSI